MPQRLLATISCILALIALAGASPAWAQGTVIVPAGPLGTALKRYATLTNRQILFDPDLVRGKRVRRLAVPAEGEAGLNRILRGSGLEASILNSDVIVIRRATRARSGNAPQSPGSKPEPPPAAPPDNVVVTALKRPTLVFDTPDAVTVLLPDEIATHRLTELHDLSKISPSLSVVDSRNGEQRVAIRGVYGTGEATVGVYFGETPVTGPSGTTLDPSGTTPDIQLVDMDRVELLNGPQGTLYGASSMGGTLRLLFHQPEMGEWSGRVTLGGEMSEGGRPGHEFTSILNVPLVDETLALRAVAYRSSSSPYIDKPALGRHDVGKVQRRGERVLLSWLPAPSVKLTGTFFSHRLSLDDSVSWSLGRPRYQNRDLVMTPYSSRLRLGNVTAEADLGPARLTASLSHYRWNLIRQSDFTAVLAAQRDNPAGCARYFGLDAAASCNSTAMAQYADFVDSRLPGLLYQPMAVRSTNGELRVQSPDGDASEWTVGFFFEDRSDNVQSYAAKGDKTTGHVLLPLDVTGLRTIDTGLTQQALFGEYNLAITKRLKLTAGIRGFVYNRTASGEVIVPNVLTGTGNIAEGLFSTREYGTSLKFGLSYKLHDDMLLYIKAAQGFRPGGVNITPGLTADEQTYASDHLWSYEAGMKVQGFLRSDIQAAVYHIDWRDMIYFTASSNGAFSYNTNVGSVRINGAELNLNLALASFWSLRGRVSYTDARLANSGALALGARPGDRLPDVAPVSFALDMAWRPPIDAETDGRFQLSAHGSGSTNSRFNSSFDYYEHLAGHIVFDFSAMLERQSWMLGFGVNNMFNAISPTRIVSSLTSRQRVYGSQPRTYFLRLSREF